MTFDRRNMQPHTAVYPGYSFQTLIFSALPLPSKIKRAKLTKLRNSWQIKATVKELYFGLLEKAIYSTWKSRQNSPCPADSILHALEAPQSPTRFAQMDAVQLLCELCAPIHQQNLFHFTAFQIILQTVTLKTTTYLLKSWNFLRDMT